MITIIGTATIDLIAHVSDEFLARHQLGKGVNTVISHEKQAELIPLFDYKIIPGGSGANQAACLALLGCPDVKFMGPTGKDEFGQMSRQSLSDVGVISLFTGENCPTQLIFTFLTPDGDRSFASYYDERMDLPQQALEDLDPTCPIVIHGFAMLYPRLGKTLAAHAAFHGPRAPLIFCPNDTSVIEDAAEDCRALYKACSHILLNSHEAEGLLNTPSIPDQIALMQKDGKSGAITDGENGSYIFMPDSIVHQPTVFDKAHFVDSNGAGDAYAAGYIYSLVHSLPIEKAALLGSKSAAALLATSGARAPFDIKDRVFTENS